MRGKAHVFLVVLRHIRITPAYAGKSIIIYHRKYGVLDHPRLCGEKFVGEMLRKIVEGSPPPMRGKV